MVKRNKSRVIVDSEDEDDAPEEPKRPKVIIMIDDFVDFNQFTKSYLGIQWKNLGAIIIKSFKKPKSRWQSRYVGKIVQHFCLGKAFFALRDVQFNQNCCLSKF